VVEQRQWCCLHRHSAVGRRLAAQTESCWCSTDTDHPMECPVGGQRRLLGMFRSHRLTSAPCTRTRTDAEHDLDLGDICTNTRLYSRRVQRQQRQRQLCHALKHELMQSMT